MHNHAKILEAKVTEIELKERKQRMEDALAATKAASFTRFARSAPENPGVPRAITEGSTSSPIGTFFI